MEQSSKTQPESNLQLLTHRTKDGSLLQRSPEVEAQIRETLSLPEEELIRRANLPDIQDPNCLKEEALVYLIRAYHKSGNELATSQLSEALIKRTVKFINSKFRGLDKDEAEDAYSEVISELFQHILFREDGRGDYLQVRFWSALKRLVISAFRRQITRIKEDRMTLVRLSDLAGYESEEDGEDQEALRTGSIPLTDVVDPGPSIDRSALISDGLHTLSEPLRTAYILRHFHDWQIESTDPAEPTLSKHFSKTPKTIYNWLKKADEALERWRGEHHE